MLITDSGKLFINHAENNNHRSCYDNIDTIYYYKNNNEYMCCCFFDRVFHVSDVYEHIRYENAKVCIFKASMCVY